MVARWPITGLFFNEAFDVAVDSQDNVWVSTRRDYLIKKYDVDGNPLPGDIDVGLRIAGIHIDDQDRIFVAVDHGFFGEVRRYDNGSLALTICPINNPQNIATDSAGNVWVTAGDSFIDPNKTLKKYDAGGSPLETFEILPVPPEIHIDDSDRVYLSVA